ncbi:MAG: hypothetical protein A2927_02155 [Candidatus Komeilibacteria bacterium RIFCSPLOWO2_01_FULL_45_10]|uniref:Uncharacterized protein n=1 Tax=Candidatus Komeilibacteria bacterium RIFCSPLOWO2_01_FULL_45_10 TaxID=1798550 RepID=A0A1G2BJV9_9BACT|nr:MAG: hypothetical protein A2927_02155 [Candidatus Komeilibacteria bacterium RIFCSPLOWO2_01_FULL_45_10]
MNVEEPKIESKDLSQEGKVVCSYCGGIIGEFKGEGTSHGICPNCRLKLERGEIEAPKQTFDFEGMAKVLAQEKIGIIESAMPLEEKLKALLEDQSYDGFIASQLRLTIDHNSTEEHLQDVAKALKMRFGLE